MTAKVYEAVKNDVAYVQDKTVTTIKAKGQIVDYLTQRGTINNATVQTLCGFNRNQAIYILRTMQADGTIEREGRGKSTAYHLRSEPIQ